MGQEELERAFDAFCRHVRRDLAGTINAGLAPRFVKCDGERDAYTIAYETAGWMRNPNGVTHGGIIAAMLDNAMGVITHVRTPGEPTATVSLEVSYVRPVPVGRELRVDVEVSRVGGTIAHITSRMYCADEPGVTLATGAGVYHMGARTPTGWKEQAEWVCREGGLDA